MYITNSNLGKKGRFGNALFQYALLRSISVKTNKKIYLDYITKCKSDGQLFLLSNLKLYLKPEQPPPSTETLKNEPFGSFKSSLTICFFAFSVISIVFVILNINGYQI